MTESPTPFAPISSLTESFKALESKPNKDLQDQLEMERLGEYLQWRKANPLLGDPQ